MRLHLMDIIKFKCQKIILCKKKRNWGRREQKFQLPNADDIVIKG